MAKKTWKALPSLRTMRIQRGFSQNRLAMLAEMSQPDLSAIETGRKAAGALRRRRLAIVLRMPEHQLFAECAAEGMTI